MEAKNLTYPKMQRWRKITHKPSRDYTIQNGVHLREKGNWSELSYNK